MNPAKPLISLDSIITKYDLKLLVYFGSFATGEYREGQSDLDIAFLSQNRLSVEERIGLLHDLALYHRKSEIDLVDLNQADPLLKYEIATKGRLLYEAKIGFYDEYCLYSVRYYYDTKHLREQAREFFQRKLEEELKDAK